MKKRNIYEKRLNTYRELLKKFIDEEEVRVVLEQPVRLNLTNVHYYSAYYQGARMGILRASEWMLDRIKGEEKVYAKAELDLITKDVRHTEMFLQGQTIRYRNHEKKGKKLVKCEAYFSERVTMDVEVEF